jgi:nucleoside-diphosphate-sugar epimerase
MRVLITGATGFVGGALARRLASEGMSVRALARPAASVAPLAAEGIDVALGDVRDPASVAAAMRGCTHVVHLAAAKSGPASLLHDVNVRGTQHVVDAARDAGVERFVYGSTLGVHGFVVGTPLDERSPARPNTPYRRSKWRGEQIVRAASERLAMPAVVARISTVVGAGALGWLPLARGIAAGRMRLIGDGSNAIDLVPIDDLAGGLARCAVTPSIEGRCYVLGAGTPSTVASFTRTIARALGVPAPRQGHFPAAPYRAAQRLAALGFRLVGRTSRHLHDREALVADKRAVSERARVELGYAPTASVDDAIQAMVDDWLERGWIPERRPA